MENLARLDCADGLAVVTFNAPQQHNAFDEAMLQRLLAVFIQIECDQTVRSVIVTAKGPVFSAGGRIDSLADLDDLPARLSRLIDLAHALVRRVAGLPVPVVMALNGVVAGGAIGLALTGDYIVAADVVRFRTAYAALGLVGDAGVTKLLTEALGVRRARSLMLTNRCFTAVDAASWGMIDEVVSAAQLAGRARELALQFAAGPTAAFRRMKALLAEAADSSYEGQLDRERDEMLEAAHTADVREGIRAFMEKRQPIFVGR